MRYGFIPVAKRLPSTAVGGSGGGLAITGSPVGLVAGAGGAAVVLGVVLMFAFRRRRLVVEMPQD